MLVIIQARSGSKRFKNKVLYPIYNKPLIFHVISKIKRSTKKFKIVVSTSLDKSDDKLVNYLKSINVNYYRGSLNNVAQRLYKTSTKYKSPFFVRINGDSPLFDYRILNRALNLKKKNKKFDLITNVFPRTFPKGQSIEIVRISSLKKNLNKFNFFDKEHVTTYFYKNAKKFKIINFTNKYKLNSMKLAIDTINDLNNIKKRYKKEEFLNFKLK